ncbi:hypothetical protein EXE59_17730 [Nocardioides eburneiflavus]|uniref:Uncharacterized protein n=1 Tax=Nocardioides eburneiflavus TaxID=2518372 RepID=A0A4Z1CLA0_9ACTN|nr:hypothetical protein [Nocardioides eburneiflavus]TGN65590.1 hypothetical protein EXE59_17730 [Nocardioides eburneiflavus]
MSAPPADVVDRLERLAAHAPGGAIDPDAVWTHGRRRRRVRLGAALAAVAAVGLLGATTTPLLVERAQRVQPADVGERMVLPDVIRQPGGWEPAFPSTPGRLSAVGVGTRSGLWSDRNAFWGVSAATGESRFLDLPGSIELGQPALSHDGSRVAYWIATTADVDALGQAGESAMLADGVAVLDLETGKRDAWTVESDHGLWVGGLAWAGDVLWWSAGPAQAQGDGALAARTRPRTWDLDTGERDDTPSSVQRRVSPNGVGHAPGGFVQQPSSRRLTLVSGHEPTTLRLMLPDDAPSAAGTTDATVSTDGSLVATLLMPDASTYDESPKAVLVGDLEGRDVALRRIGDVSAQSVLGWRSATELVVASVDDVEAGRPQRASRARILDVTSGAQDPLLAFSGNTPHVAADAWTAEVVPAPDAPFAPDPRLVGLGLLAAAFVGWRITVRVRSRRGHA